MGTLAELHTSATDSTAISLLTFSKGNKSLQTWNFQGDFLYSHYEFINTLDVMTNLRTKALENIF